MFDQPLGLPQGSVRAILSIIITIASLVLMFVRSEFPQDLAPILAMVMTYYFVKREDETSK